MQLLKNASRDRDLNAIDQYLDLNVLDEYDLFRSPGSQQQKPLKPPTKDHIRAAGAALLLPP